MENAFKERLFGNLLKRDYAQVTRIHSGEWMNRLTSDTVVCANSLTEILPGIVGMLARLVGALVMIALLAPALVAIIFPCGVFFVLMAAVVRKHLKQLHKSVQEQDGKQRGYLQEHIENLLVIHAFGTEDAVLLGARTAFKEYKEARMKKGLSSNICNSIFSFAMNGMYLLGIAYCGYGILKGTVSYGTLTAIMQLTGQIQNPLANIGGFVPRYYAMIASAERLMEIETYLDAELENMKTEEEVKKLYKELFEKIEFQNVSFLYDENRRVKTLDGVNFTIKKGDFIAITGVSGCGKSTLLKLLLGVYEQRSGEINVVTREGKAFPIKEWRRMFSYVPQGNFLMSGTIREAIVFHNQMKRKNYMPVEKALQLACADFVWDFPKGVDTLLGEKGTGLSEGQIQRIAIARSLYADAPILILDEATSALDEATEKRLLEQLRQLTDKTVLIVTHRMNVLDICNKRIDMSEMKL